MLMLKKWFGSSSSSNASKDEIRRRECLSKLNESLEKLEGKERILQSKISIENERTKNFTKSRNNRAVLECKKRKSFYEAQVEQLEIFRLQIVDQTRMLRDAVEMTEP